VIFGQTRIELLFCMPELDQLLAGAGENGALAFFVALLLGLRHATDPDHLTAVSTLVLSDHQHGARRAGALGLAWGLGHATTLVVFGLPVVLFRRYLPEMLVRAAEVTIGMVIVVLALRLLIRWARGYFHTHPHSHDGVQHSHPHLHERSHAGDEEIGHSHPHASELGRSPVAAFGIGMVHGLGGSAGVGILVVTAATSQLRGIIALLLFAAGTAVSMALVSASFGYALTRGPVTRRVRSLVPFLALVSLAFGTWYALEAVRGGASGL
jgi:cytochrome c biogenesis protein CcdA